MKHRLLLLLIGLFVIAGNKAVADDVYFTVDKVDVMPGNSAQVTMYYDADGSREYKGFQIEFVLPDGLHLTDAALGPEVAANNPQMGINYSDRRSDGCSVIMGFQISLTPMPIGEGIELCSFSISADEDCELGEYSVTTTKIEFASDQQVLFGPKTITYNVISSGREGVYFTADEVDVRPGQSAKVTMCYNADGSENNTGFQIEFVLPDGLHLTDAVLGPDVAANNPEMMIVFNDRRSSDGKSVILGYQGPSTPMPIGEGIELCSFFITADNNCELGEYSVTTTKIEFAAGNQVEYAPQTITFNVISSGREGVYFTADEVDVMQGKSAKVTMCYDADGSENNTGFQIEFVLPDGLHLTDAVLGPYIAANNPDMWIDFNDRRPSDGKSVILGYQLPNTPMPIGEGIELCSFIITADNNCELGEYSVTTTKIEFAAGNQVEYAPKTITYNVIPYSRRLLLDTNTDLPISSSAPEDVVVKRTIKADTWSTLTLPFDLSDDQVADIFGNNVKVAEYQGYSINEKQQYVMKFETVDALSQGLDNNTPYLIKTDKSLDEFSADGVLIEADEDKAIVERDNNSSVIGTLRAGKIPANCLFLRDNNFFVSKGDSKINAFRAYFKIDGYEYKTTDTNISFMIDGEETSIEGIIVNGNEIVSGDVYSVNGTFMGRAENVMNDLPKGVYIVNNKKVVVK